MSTKPCLRSFPGVSLRGVCLWVCLLGKFSSLMEERENRRKPQSSPEMRRTHSDSIVRLHALLPPPIFWGLKLEYPEVSQTWMISNLDSQLEDSPNLNPLPVSLAPFNKNNNACSFLLGKGGRVGRCTRPSRYPLTWCLHSFGFGMWLLKKTMPSAIIDVIVMYVWDREWTFWGNL